jgi:hypothetical protein
MAADWGLGFRVRARQESNGCMVWAEATSVTCSRRSKTFDGSPATAWQVVMMLAACRVMRGDE